MTKRGVEYEYRERELHKIVGRLMLQKRVNPKKEIFMNGMNVMSDKTRGRVVAYVVSIAIALGIGGLSALLTSKNMDIYADLRQPPLAPPAILFPIVWTVLYVLMGVSAAMVYTAGGVGKSERSDALMPYGASLFVNFFWPILFFNFRAFLPAFVWLILLEFLIVMTILSYRKLNTGAAYLQIPYAIWVAFAGYLNFAIWVLNR